MGKVVEKTMATWISNWYEQNQLLHKGQFGCRRNCGTLDALAQLVTTVKKAWQEKQLVAALLLNIKGAFDYINRRQLLKVLKELGLLGNLLY